LNGDVNITRLVATALLFALVAGACSPPSRDATSTVDTGTQTPIAPDDSTVVTDENPTDQSDDAASFAGTQPAPEFPTGLDWLNVDRPLTLEELQGKIVLLDFWTYGCINCIHIIPDLHQLEAEYADELVVIGVHSAKFLNEAETDNIRQVVQRYDIEHPVVNDRAFEVWREWGANAWPTVVLVDPAGNIVGGHSGEGVYQTVQPVVSSLVAEFDELGLIDRSPVDLTPEAVGTPDRVLSFPGKVVPDDTGTRIFIADTGHHRVVVADAATGTVLDVYGGPEPGFTDGVDLNASFDSPQGLAYAPADDLLYVADTNNHAIRVVDLSTGEVSLLAGTGSLSWPPTGGVAPEVTLNSPWGLTLRNGVLYIAMAGSHQIWSAELATGIVAPLVGNARESTLNGPIAEAELAQPSGLAFDAAGTLYFADSESSSIRSAGVLEPGGETAIVAGSDANLFDFGDEDGVGTAARLQHPLGIAYDEASGLLYVADTYNSKIKHIDPGTGGVTTAFGGTQGWADGNEAQFYEPGGLALHETTLYVADTNNHVIRAVDLKTGTASTLILNGIERFRPLAGSEEFQGETVVLDPTVLGAGAGTITVDLGLPAGYKVNEQAPSSVVVSVEGTAVSLGDEFREIDLTGAELPLQIPAEFVAGSAEVQLDVTLIYCRNEAESLCFIEQLRLLRSVEVAGAGVGVGVDLVFTHAVEVRGDQ
jgi:DNA-binding beta-propeller fold protein YncE